jgi:hypothetical protein
MDISLDEQIAFAQREATIFAEYKTVETDRAAQVCEAITKSLEELKGLKNEHLPAVS